MFREIMLLVWLATVPFASMAAARTSAEEAACRRDAVHFCRGMSDEFQVRDCLVAQKRRISPHCRAVLESHGF